MHLCVRRVITVLPSDGADLSGVKLKTSNVAARGQMTKGPASGIKGSARDAASGPRRR